MVWCTIALAEGARASGQFIQLLLPLRHQPTGQNSTSTITPFRYLSGQFTVDFTSGDTGNDANTRLCVSVFCQLKTHVPHEFGFAKTEGNTVGKVRLYVHDEVLALGKLLFGSSFI